MDCRYCLHLLQLGQSQLWETPGLFQPSAPSPPLSDSHVAFDGRSKGPWLSVCLCKHICIDHICSCEQSPQVDVFHQASRPACVGVMSLPGPPRRCHPLLPTYLFCLISHQCVSGQKRSELAHLLLFCAITDAPRPKRCHMLNDPEWEVARKQ